MSRLHAFVQKRQLLIMLVMLIMLLVIIFCALGGCAPDRREDLQPRIASFCNQQCGAVLDERTFVCIDHCYLDSDRAYLR